MDYETDEENQSVSIDLESLDGDGGGGSDDGGGDGSGSDVEEVDAPPVQASDYATTVASASARMTRKEFARIDERFLANLAGVTRKALRVPNSTHKKGAAGAHVESDSDSPDRESDHEEESTGPDAGEGADGPYIDLCVGLSNPGIIFDPAVAELRAQDVRREKIEKMDLDRGRKEIEFRMAEILSMRAGGMMEQYIEKKAAANAVEFFDEKLSDADYARLEANQTKYDYNRRNTTGFWKDRMRARLTGGDLDVILQVQHVTIPTMSEVPRTMEMPITLREFRVTAAIEIFNLYRQYFATNEVMSIAETVKIQCDMFGVNMDAPLNGARKTAGQESINDIVMRIEEEKSVHLANIAIVASYILGILGPIIDRDGRDTDERYSITYFDALAGARISETGPSLLGRITGQNGQSVATIQVSRDTIVQFENLVRAIRKRHDSMINMLEASMCSEKHIVGRQRPIGVPMPDDIFYALCNVMPDGGDEEDDKRRRNILKSLEGKQVVLTHLIQQARARYFNGDIYVPTLQTLSSGYHPGTYQRATGAENWLLGRLSKLETGPSFSDLLNSTGLRTSLLAYMAASPNNTFCPHLFQHPGLYSTPTGYFYCGSRERGRIIQPRFYPFKNDTPIPWSYAVPMRSFDGENGHFDYNWLGDVRLRRADGSYVLLEDTDMDHVDYVRKAMDEMEEEGREPPVDSRGRRCKPNWFVDALRIPTPKADRIFEDQDYMTPGQKRVIWAMFGRFLYPPMGTEEHIMIALIGETGTGKSTWIDILTHLFGQHNVAVVGDTYEKTFGLSEIMNKPIWAVRELTAELVLAFRRATMLQLVALEWQLVAMKFLKPQLMRPRGHGIAAGNDWPFGDDTSGALSRRAFIIHHKNKIPTMIQDLARDIAETEGLRLICKWARLCLPMADALQRRNMDVWQWTLEHDPIFVQTRNMFAAYSNPITRFIESPDLLPDPNFYMPLPVFMEAFKEFAQRFRLPIRANVTSMEALRSSLARKGYRIERAIKCYPIGTNRQVNNDFVFGVDVRPSDMWPSGQGHGHGQVQGQGQNQDHRRGGGEADEPGEDGFVAPRPGRPSRGGRSGSSAGGKRTYTGAKKTPARNDLYGEESGNED